MKTITITVEVDGNEVSRNYEFDHTEASTWGDRIVDMLDTLEKSDVKEF